MRAPGFAHLAHSGAVVGTFLVGKVSTTYDQLVATFGEPTVRYDDSEKITVEWQLVFDDATIATVYDWKESETPLGLHDWHVGGKSSHSARLVADALEAVA